MVLKARDRAPARPRNRPGRAVGASVTCPAGREPTAPAEPAPQVSDARSIAARSPSSRPPRPPSGASPGRYRRRPTGPAEQDEQHERRRQHRRGRPLGRRGRPRGGAGRPYRADCCPAIVRVPAWAAGWRPKPLVPPRLLAPGPGAQAPTGTGRRPAALRTRGTAIGQAAGGAGDASPRTGARSWREPCGRRVPPPVLPTSAGRHPPARPSARPLALMTVAFCAAAAGRAPGGSRDPVPARGPRPARPCRREPSRSPTPRPR